MIRVSLFILPFVRRLLGVPRKFLTYLFVYAVHIVSLGATRRRKHSLTATTLGLGFSSQFFKDKGVARTQQQKGPQVDFMKSRSQLLIEDIAHFSSTIFYC